MLFVSLLYYRLFFAFKLYVNRIIYTDNIFIIKRKGLNLKLIKKLRFPLANQSSPPLPFSFTLKLINIYI